MLSFLVFPVFWYLCSRVYTNLMEICWLERWEIECCEILIEEDDLKFVLVKKKHGFESMSLYY